MTEQEIIKALALSIDDRKYPFQIPTSFIYGWESDYWAMTAGGETREFEIKCSRSDFFADAQKLKHANTNGANYFYYVCPVGLILPTEVDKRYGLMYVSESNISPGSYCIEIIKKPRRLNNNEFDQWKMLANKCYWKWYSLWRDKLIGKEITREQYAEGFTLSLTEQVEP